MLTIAGMAGAGSTPAGGRLVWQTFAPDRRGLALGIRQTGVPLGGVVAAATLPALANVTSWRTSIVTAALVALLSTIPLHAMRDRGRMAPVARSRERVRAINRDVRLLTVWGCLAMTGQFAVLTYMPLDAHQRAGLSLAAAASLAAVAQATGIAGRVLWGWLSDRGGHGGRNAQLLLLTVGSICAVGLVLLLPTGAPLALWVLCAAALGITVIGFQGLWLTMLTEVANPAAVGAATGFAVMCTIGSVTVTPPLFGAFADEFGTYRAVWVLLIAVLAVALVPILQLHKATSEATLQAAA
jgi:sugar phosphate permease